MEGRTESDEHSPLHRASSGQQTATTFTVDARIIDEPITIDRPSVEVTVETPIPNGNATSLGNENQMMLRIFLYGAALRGDWKAAQTAWTSDTNIVHIRITPRGDTVLHIAAAAKRTAFVCKLVQLLHKDELALQNKYKNTAFCFAAVSGVVKIAMIMYKKNENLPKIRGRKGMTPLEMAVLMGNRKMAHFLYKVNPLTDSEADERLRILEATIQSEMYDIALEIFNADTSIVSSPNVGNGGRLLCALAQKPLSHVGGSSHKCILERLLRTVSHVPCFKHTFGALQTRRQAGQLLKELWKHMLKTLQDSAITTLFVETPILKEAVKIGNVEFLTLLTQSYPDLIWKVDSADGYSIFHFAVINRQEKVFSLIHDIGAIKDILTLSKDHYGNNILHLAGKSAPQSRLDVVSGAALQMQRELLWFNEVKKIVRPSYAQMKNGDDRDDECKRRTPKELFTEEHGELRKAGEEWMKSTSSSCMVVATLIATVALAAAFTVPGGNNGETGAPIFLEDWWFTVFVISNAVAMFSSTTSIVMFLSILTSRYAEDDFLFKLPAKLMIGLFTLFVSVVCMGSTFGATFFLAYKEEEQGTLPILIAALACLPLILYAMLNYSLWKALIHSACRPSWFIFRPKYRLFSNNNSYTASCPYYISK